MGFCGANKARTRPCTGDGRSLIQSRHAGHISVHGSSFRQQILDANIQCGCDAAQKNDGNIAFASFQLGKVTGGYAGAFGQFTAWQALRLACNTHAGCEACNQWNSSVGYWLW